jgi:hypothetical protein
MKCARTPGAGITGAPNSLAGDGASLAQAGHTTQRTGAPHALTIIASRPANPPCVEVCRLALNLARNCGYAVLPCSADAQPLISIGNASKLPLAISNAWLRNPGPLIGIATGAVSDLWTLAISQEAKAWWCDNHSRLLPTRCYQIPDAGVHCHYRDGRSIALDNRTPPGVSTYGDGECVIHWFSAGLLCHDHSSPAPWPEWLRDALGLPA